MQVEFSNGTFASVVLSETFTTCGSLLWCLVFVFPFSFILRSTRIESLCVRMDSQQGRRVSQNTFCKWMQTPLFSSRLCSLLTFRSTRGFAVFFFCLETLSASSCSSEKHVACSAGWRERGGFPWHCAQGDLLTQGAGSNGEGWRNAWQGSQLNIVATV